MRSTAWRVPLAFAGALTFGAVTAQAQTASANPSTQSTSSADAGASTSSGASELTEVTVTGSRVITNGNQAPTPVMVVSTAQLQAVEPQTLFTDLSTLPQFSGSRGAVNPTSTGPAGNGAVSALNLRNLGAQRDLILFDGHRVPASTPDGFVDVNVLPEMLIQRVDTVTGGASAIYGSDAVTGVVNFITDTKFQGVKVNLQGGRSAYNDDGSYALGIAFGQSLFGGRGHIEGSLERHQNDGLYTTARAWALQDYILDGNGTAATPYKLVQGVRNTSASFGGVIACPAGTAGAGYPNASGCPGVPLVGMEFAQDGVATPFVHGATIPGNTALGDEIGGDGLYHTFSLLDASRQDQGFLRFDYDVTDTIHGSLLGSWSEDNLAGRSADQRSFPPGWKIGACNAFLAQQYQTALGCNPVTGADPTFTYERLWDPSQSYGAAQNSLLLTHNYFVMADLNGKFGLFSHSYNWDVGYTASENSQLTGGQIQTLPNLYASLDAVVNPANGQIVCRVTLTNPAQYPGCVPFNVFGPNAPSAAAINYIFNPIYIDTKNQLNDVSASLTGSPLSDWAGPIGVALSGELRRNTLSLTSNSTPTQTVNCAGLMFGNCTPGVTLTYLNTVAALPEVDNTVGELAVETNVPLLKDLPAVKSLEFDGAGRYTRYNNASNNPSIASPSFIANTWKLGVVWNVTDQLTLRWARSRDIRAPTLYDLFAPTTIGAAGFINDYLEGGKQYTATPLSGGNPNLLPEVGHTSTEGIVWQPLRQWSMSLDYYDITITNAIYSLAGTSQVVQQACYASGGTSPLCQLQVRPFGCCSNTTAANQITAYYTRNVNVASQRTWGADFESNYAARVLGRPLSLRLLVSYQPHIIYAVPAAPLTEVAGVAYNGLLGLQPAPVWRGSLFAHYGITDRWSVDARERYRSLLNWSRQPGVVQIGDDPPVEYTDLTVTYEAIMSAAQQLELYVNVQNVFNTPPPPAASPLGSNPTYPGISPNGYAVGDDVVGRYFTVGLRMKF